MRADRILPRLGVALCVLAVGAAHGSFSLPTAHASVLVTFNSTQSGQTYTIPAGVTRIEVTVQSSATGRYQPSSAPGGPGATFVAQLDVTPGQTFQVGFLQSSLASECQAGPDAYLPAARGWAASIQRVGDTNPLDHALVAGTGGAPGCSSNTIVGGEGGAAGLPYLDDTGVIPGASGGNGTVGTGGGGGQATQGGTAGAKGAGGSCDGLVGGWAPSSSTLLAAGGIQTNSCGVKGGAGGAGYSGGGSGASGSTTSAASGGGGGSSYWAAPWTRVDVEPNYDSQATSALIEIESVLSSNADLSSLVLSEGTLDPVFSAATTSYSASVGNGVSSLTVTPTASDAGATVTVDRVSVTSGSASGAIPLSVGLTTIEVEVTAADSSTKNYTVVVERASLPPDPNPFVYPPSAPRDVAVTAGDGGASVTWREPESSGSFPITDYQVEVSPGGAACLAKVPALTCTVSGLSNGTTYTAKVRALNGAGWGTWSSESERFTPQGPAKQSILISGSRTTAGLKGGVEVTGETTGLVGEIVRARVHLAGEVDYEDGTSRVVRSDGTFQWERKTGKRVYVYFVAEEGAVRSNRIVIPPQ